MNRILLVLIPLGAAVGGHTAATGGARLDSTRAFYFPDAVHSADDALAATNAGPIDGATYARYLAMRLGTRHLADLAFDFVLARECEARGILRSAPMLARSMASRRLKESGRTHAADPDRNLRARFATEALRQLRIDALVGAARSVDANALRALFDHRYGVDGARVHVRQVLVSLAGTRRRIGSDADEAIVAKAAHERAKQLHGRVVAGTPFAQLLSESDDRTTRRMLRAPDKRALAGTLEGYNYDRYGDSFAAAVRSLEVGGTRVVQTAMGSHLIELVSRTKTDFDDVAPRLARELRGGKATQSEQQALRRELFAKYEVQLP